CDEGGDDRRLRQMRRDDAARPCQNRGVRHNGGMTGTISTTLARRIAGAIALLILCCSTGALAQTGTDQGFGAYLQSLRPKARAMGVTDATFDRAITGLSFNPRVAALDADNRPTPADAPIPDF